MRPLAPTAALALAVLLPSVARAASDALVPVPEPVTALLFGAGLAGLGVFGRRRS